MIEAKGGDSWGISERRYEERRLRAQAQRCEQDEDALISAKSAEIRQIEPCVVRLAHRPPPGKRPPEAEINLQYIIKKLP